MAKAQLPSRAIRVPDPAGTHGEQATDLQRLEPAPPQVSIVISSREPKLPNPMSFMRVRYEPCSQPPSVLGLPLRPGCGAGAPVPAERQTNSKKAWRIAKDPAHRSPGETKMDGAADRSREHARTAFGRSLTG
ncbi:hypothetical protein GCM10011579_059820 [Streptomyces albiflavescens]|uniref:Uncharacterized protein n=1 Tax=Streptomyces albiflavescens TaxID=1623582 RepID=A0A918D6W1_9ACTN|nr:hypothetical protein GCM10011579_059820 [Streptomyces albiflavescens]